MCFFLKKKQHNIIITPKKLYLDCAQVRDKWTFSLSFVIIGLLELGIRQGPYIAFGCYVFLSISSPFFLFPLNYLRNLVVLS